MESNLPIDEALYEQGYNQAIKDLNDCDWQAFRREAVKDILAGMCANYRIYGLSDTELATSAINLADELIKLLKQE